METSSSLSVVVWVGAIFRWEAFPDVLLRDSLLQNVAVSVTVIHFSASWGISKLYGPGCLLDLSRDHQLHLNQLLMVRSFTHWGWWESPGWFQWAQYHKLKTRNTGKEAFKCCYVQKKLLSCFRFSSVCCSVNKITTWTSALIQRFGFCRQAIKKNLYWFIVWVVQEACSVGKEADMFC